MPLTSATLEDIDPAAKRIAEYLTDHARISAKTASDFRDSGDEANASYWDEHASFLLNTASQLSTTLAIAALGLSKEQGRIGDA